MLSKTYLRISFSFVILINYTFTKGQDCGCDYNMYPSEFGQLFDAKDVKPGESICMHALDQDGKAGTYNEWTAFHNITGTKDKPVIIKNCGGQVIINARTEGLQTVNSTYFEITGTGDQNTFYGFKINGGTDGVRINTFSNNYNVNHIAINGTINHGFDLKNDPFCNDPRSWRSSGISNDYIIAHDNRVTNIGLEGFYVGDSHYHTDVDCIWAGNEFPTVRVEESAIRYVALYNNYVDSTGNDGIQVGSVIDSALIFNNEIRNYGLTDQTGQHRSGFQINPGTKGKLFKNKVIHGRGTAFFVSGDGLEMYNNLAIDVKTAVESYDNLTSTTSSYKIYNNTFINVFESGIAIIAADYTRANNLLYNNIIHGLEGIDFWPYQKGLAFSDSNIAHNIFTQEYDSLNFVDPVNQNFGLTANALNLIDKGNCTPFSIFEDHLGNDRTFGLNCDIGAFEFEEDIITFIQGHNQSPFTLYPNPVKHAEKVSLAFNRLANDTKTIKLLDLSGKPVFETQCNQLICSFELPLRLSCGVYLLQIKNGNQNLQMKKVVIEK